MELKPIKVTEPTVDGVILIVPDGIETSYYCPDTILRIVILIVPDGIETSTLRICLF